MKKDARILITEACQYNCSYCCNKIPEQRARFKEVENISEVPVEDYTNISITGGEPLINILDLHQVLADIEKRNDEANLFLYTNLGNGLFATHYSWLLHVFSGITVGIHNLNQLKDIHKNLILFLAYNNQIRFKLQKKSPFKIVLEKLGLLNIEEYSINECETNEDIYLIKGGI